MGTVQKRKSPYGQLVWIEDKTNIKTVIRTGPWALLNSIKSSMQQDTAYAKGKFKLTNLNQ